MKYEVLYAANKDLHSVHDSEADAIAAAESINVANDPAVVIAHEVSGTYESRQQVWPSVGERYSK